MYLAVWVDDGAIFSNSLSDANEVISALKETFEIKVGEVDMLVGTQITRNRETRSECTGCTL